MRVYQAIHFDSDDNHIELKLQQIESWCGIAQRDEADPIRKAFRRLRGNGGSVDDLKTALSAALEIAQTMKADAETATCPFPEIPGQSGSVEETWRNGLRQQPLFVERQVESIVDMVEEDHPGLLRDVVTPSSQIDIDEEDSLPEPG